jgi:hypothetical protein
LSAPAGSRSRGFTAGMTAANDYDVESNRHQKSLGCCLVAEARGGVKTMAFS